MAGTCNPVQCSGPIDSDRDFVVRFCELEEYAEAEIALRTSGTLFICGPFRTGKMSLACGLTPTQDALVWWLSYVRRRNGNAPLLLVVDELDTLACAESKDGLAELLNFIRAERDIVGSQRICTICICTFPLREIAQLAPAREGCSWNVGTVIYTTEFTLEQASRGQFRKEAAQLIPSSSADC
eukprot:m51a1_g5410 hypothetical protein (183) ;mRNA; f:87891-88788